MKNNTLATLLTLIIFTYAQSIFTESLQEKKDRLAYERKVKAEQKAKRKAERKRKDAIRSKEKKARQKSAAEEQNTVFEKSKKWDDYVPARFMKDIEKGFAPNKTDSITQINDSFTF